MFKLKNHWREAILLILLTGNALIWWQVAHYRPAILTVAFLDIGQGDAVYIEAPNGNQVLIDGGPGRGVLRALGEVIPWNDKKLDLMIATHPDADHLGGLSAVLDRFQVLGVMDNGQTSNTGYSRSWQMAKEAETKAGARVLLARRGQKIFLADDIYLDILSPLTVPTGRDTNDGSVIAKLTYSQTNFLFTGDASTKIELSLLNQLSPAVLDVDVLKAGHHGSKTSSAPSFVDTVSPIYAIISAGKDNRYGHPHAQTLQTLRAAGAAILSTAESGTIICESNGLVINCSPAAL